jgi:CubicO group peptidase (beta-lactamase class C family)
MINIELEPYVEELVRQDAFSGTVLIEQNSEPIFKQAYGFAHYGFQIPNQINTKYNIGSCTKMFTALAIGQLAQEGKIKLSDPVSAYLADYPREIADKVTLHHLLTHTSGMAESILNEKTFHCNKDKVRTTADWLALVLDTSLLFEPSTSWSYSNAGFVVLGAVIEEVTGKSYFDYVRESIWLPSGMNHTNLTPLDEDVPNRASGYMAREEDEPIDLPRKNNIPYSLIRGNAHGGAWSTVEDMLRFANALNNNTLLDKVHTDILWAPKVVTGWTEGDEAVRNAYGFFVTEIDGHRIIGHGGITAGFNARFQMYSDLDVIVVILANYSFPAAHQLGQTIRELLLKN